MMITLTLQHIVALDLLLTLLFLYFEVVQATQSLQLIHLILAARLVHMIVIRTRVHMVEPKDGTMREEDPICNLVVSSSIQLFPNLLKNWRWSIKGKQLNLERFVIKKKMKKIINTVRYGSPINAIIHRMEPGVFFPFSMLRLSPPFGYSLHDEFPTLRYFNFKFVLLFLFFYIR